VSALSEEIFQVILNLFKVQQKIYRRIFSIKNIIRHASVHEENATHQCIKCNRKYGMGEAFIDHMLVHQNLKPFSCKECGKNFLKFYQLKNHLKAHSDFAKPHLCQECGKSFSEADYLNRHLKRHSGIKPYACPVCPKTFTFKCKFSVAQQLNI
jgi:KRAB domain-containing zinc finger protein